jgi:hypothetical protein
MSKKVPRKNIDPVLVDVKKPNFNYKRSSKFSNLDLKRISGEYKGSGNNSIKNILKWGVGAIVIVFIVFGTMTVANLKSTKVVLEAKGELVSNYLFDSLESIKNFETKEAQDSLVKSKEKLDEIDSLINENPKNFVLSASFKFVPFLKDVGSFLKQAAQFNVDLIHLSNILSTIQSDGFSYFRNDGEKLLELMHEGRELLGNIKSEVSFLRNKTESLGKLVHFGEMGNVLENKYFTYSNQLYAIEDFLGGAIDIFESEEEKHIILMFQNSSELRPAGGFLGSYGDLVIQKGQMKDLIVEDIYWPDHEINFDEKYIPPEPLQRVTRDWGIRDANWFFDFPTSAETVLSMLEQSKIYKEEGINFEGVIGIDVDVLGTIMEYVGEVELPDYDMTIDHENFLTELQREVETGRDKQAGENPKKILAVLAPMIMERLENFSGDELERVMDDLNNHINNKEIVFYARDKKISNFFQKNELAGSIYELPDSFWGGYLAVVNSNIAGGKTDAFINQEINVWLNVGSGGGVMGDLKITRKHNGENEEDSWYREVNKDYIKIYTNPSSNLVFMEGNDERYEIKEEYDSSYKKLDALKKIEETKIYDDTYNTWKTEEFGKTVFGTWLLTSPEEESNLEVRYESPAAKNLKLKPGEKFKFIFDKQSGSDTALNIKISAPLGYVWVESDSLIYEKNIENVSKRETINLTLKNQFEEEFIKE